MDDQTITRGIVALIVLVIVYAIQDVVILGLTLTGAVYLYQQLKR